MTHSIRRFSEPGNGLIYERTGDANRWSRWSKVVQAGRIFVRVQGPGIDRLYEPTKKVLKVAARLCIDNANDEGVVIGPMGEKVVARYRAELAERNGQAA